MQTKLTVMIVVDAVDVVHVLVFVSLEASLSLASDVTSERQEKFKVAVVPTA